MHTRCQPTHTAPQSEYPPDCHARREFISNFTGSAGTAVITHDAALLWTDGRYFLQAEKQLSPDWALMRMGTEGCPDIPDWLAANVPAGGRVGIDPFLITVDGARKLEKQLASAGRTLLPLTGDNLVDRVWGAARPQEPLVRHSRDTMTGRGIHLLMFGFLNRSTYIMMHRQSCECMQSSGRAAAWPSSWRRSGGRLRQPVPGRWWPPCWVRRCDRLLWTRCDASLLHLMPATRAVRQLHYYPVTQTRWRGCSTCVAAMCHTTRCSSPMHSSPRTTQPSTPTPTRYIHALSLLLRGVSTAIDIVGCVDGCVVGCVDGCRCQQT